MAGVSRFERQVRTWSGVVVALFVVMHLLNHAAAIFSLQLAESARQSLALLWHSLPAIVALYAALLWHVLSALLALYRRTTLRMSGWKAAQLILGLLVVPLLAGRVIGTRGFHEVFAVELHYSRVSMQIWSAPLSVAKQVVLTLIVWLHVAVGLHFWLRVYRWYPRVRALLYAAALLLPVLALLGFARGGQQINVLAENSSAVPALFENIAHRAFALRAFFERTQTLILGGYTALVVLILLARMLRSLVVRHRTGFELMMPDGRRVHGARGKTILEALREARIPRASVCGGRGRCITCRVRVGTGQETLSPKGAIELAALERIGAPANVRLACQARPEAALSVIPLLAPDSGPEQARRPAVSVVMSRS